MAWYTEFGFRENPLDVRPNPDLVGLEKQEKKLINHITKQEVCFLNGLTGSGKSSLLIKLQKQLKGHKFIYLDAQELPRDFNIEEELYKNRSFFDRLALKNYPGKKPVLIIDEFQATDPNLVLQARASWENPVQRKIKAIVISQISKHLKNVSQSFKERLGSRTVTLEPLDEEEMIKILERRLKVPRKKDNLTDKLTDDALSFIARCAGNNPRRMLEYVDDLFEFHHQKFGEKNPLLREEYQISYFGAKEILGLEKVHVEGFENSGGESAKPTKFTKNELKILRMVDKKPMTVDEISARLKVSTSTGSKYLRGLKNKNGIVYAGKKQRKKLWQINPAAKRKLVKA